MSDSKEKSSKARKISSKAPPQIANFFSNPSTSDDVPSSLVPSSSNELHSKDRKRKLTEKNSTSENENSYALTLAKNAEKISKIPKMKRVGTLVSTFFQQEKNDGLSDFESPERRVQIKSPPVLAKKKVSRKRKQTGKQKANKDALETEIFEKVLIHHSTVDGMNSDDLQMALALSRSLVDTGEPSEDIANIIRNADPSRKEEIVRHTFQRFGFKKRDKNDYDFRDFFTNVVTNKKWFSKFTALTRRSENVQKEKFKKKVKAILQTSESFEIVDGETMQAYHPTSDYLDQYFVAESPTYNISLVATDTKIQDFYSNNLVPISNLRCGSLLKNWSDIPGRDFSPQREPLVSPELYTLMSPERDTLTSPQHDNLASPQRRDIFVSPQRDSLVTPRRDILVTPRRDILVSPHRDTLERPLIENSLSPNVANVCKSSDILNERSTCGLIEANRIEVASPGYLIQCHHVNPDESNANAKLVVDLSHNLKILNYGDAKDNKTFEADQNTNTKPANTFLEKSNECCIAGATVTALQVDKIEEKRARQASPDMFADYDTSANNSINEDTSSTNILLIHQNLTDSYIGSQLVNNDDRLSCSVTSEDKANIRTNSHLEVDLLSPSKDDITTTNVHQDNLENVIVDNYSPIDLDSSTSEDLVIDPDPDPDRRSLTQSQSSKENYEIEDRQSQGAVNFSVPRTQTSQSKYSSIDSHKMEIDLPLKSVVVKKRLSFTERLELYNSDPALDDSDENPTCCQITEPSQDSIVISDDEINYSMAGGGAQGAIGMSQVYTQSQESIEISDTEDIPTELQLPEDDIEERESFLSINLSNDDDCVSEKSLDINFVDEIFNSESLNDEDLINLSVKEICQKEFVAGSSKSSTNKNFSRTVSDMTFERKVRNTPKSPDQIIQLSDDDSDEFDLLVKGHRSFPKTPDKSTKFVDDDFDKLIKGNICDDVNVLGSSSATHSHEFIVQSMDQIYEVRTGLLVSPKPDYGNMDSPTRLEHLKKYGLKTLSKRKAVICLDHIYNQLHPFIELDGNDELNDVFSQREVRVNGSEKRFVDISSSQPTKLPSHTTNRSQENGYNVKNIVHNIVDNNFDIIQGNEDVFYLPSAPRAKKPWCLQPLHIAWHNLLKSNPALYEHILQYKPIDLLDIRLLFKSIDLRYETNDIISFLDRKCITFKTDNNRNNAVKKNCT